MLLEKLNFRKDFTGKRFGKLLVLEYAGSASNRSYWKCQCDCGKEKIVSYTSFAKRIKKIACDECSILQGSEHPSWRGFGEISKELFSRIEREAENRGLEFNVSIEYLWELFLKQERKCALTGINISFNGKSKDIHSKTVSLDRIDSTKGYAVGNVQWVHKTINHIKSNVGNDYFINLCKLVCSQQKDLSIDIDFFLRDAYK